MSSDTYEFSKSLHEQSLDHETPYSKKQWNYINDTNGGNYTVGGATLVQFDGSSIFNSNHFIPPSDMYTAVPIVRVAAFSTAGSGTAIAPTAVSITAGSEWITSLKAGHWNLLHALEVQNDGRTVIQQTPNINYYNNFTMLSNLSESDLISYGQSIGIGRLDNERSIKFSGTASTSCIGGNGVKNNNIFANVDTTGVIGTSVVGMQPLNGTFGTQMLNDGLYTRSVPSASSVVFAASAAGASNVYGTTGTLSLMSQTNMNAEFKSNFQISNNYMVWYDTAIIRLKDAHDWFAKMPLVQNLNLQMRMYLNTGVVGMTYKTGSAGPMYMHGTNNTFSSTCPLIVNNLAASAPATTAQLVAGLFIAKSVTTSMLGMNLNVSAAAHPMNSCRLYFSMVQIKPTLLPRYIESNRAKRVLYKTALYQNLANISAGATYSALIQSGVTRISGVLLIPWVSAATHGLITAVDGTAVTVGFSEPNSPFDTAPVTSCLSLTQLNVAIGGVNELMNFASYGYENFLQQVALYDKINASDLGLSCGLINQSRWELAYRYYWIDCSRYADSIADVPRNVTVTFQNNTLQAIDVAAFVESINSLTVDVVTGRLS